jgi:hypothetical protein
MMMFSLKPLFSLHKLTELINIGNKLLVLFVTFTKVLQVFVLTNIILDLRFHNR